MSKRESNKASRKSRTVTYEPRSSDISQNRRRADFLEKVRECEPRVLVELSQTPLQYFRQAGLDHPDIDARGYSHVWARLKSEHWPRINQTPLLWLRRILWDWGERWKLDEGWCLEAAFETLTDWSRDERLASERSWSIMIYAGGYVVSPIPGEDIFSFERHGWDLTRHSTRMRYEEFIRAEFEDALKAYCDQIEKAAPEYGYVEVSPPKHSLKPHLPVEWLVRYRVQGWKVKQINDHYYKSDNRNTIRKGINEAAKALGFPSYDFAGG
jgi:hypothetical protein